jgi:hypothetical protein
MARDATWTNSDGLIVGFGTHTEDNNVPAVTAIGTKTRVSMEITLADLVDTIAAGNISPQSIRIPRGAIITEAYVVVKTAAAGGGTLDIGTWGVGIATEVVDVADGLVADITTAEMNAVGEVHICDGALVSSSGNTAAAGIVSVGATSNSDVVITASYETTVFTGGVLLLVVEYIAPFGSTAGVIAN